MTVEEITKTEFERLLNCTEKYFCNGCIFSYAMDNLVAFPLYESGTEEPGKYYKVVR